MTSVLESQPPPGAMGDGPSWPAAESSSSSAPPSSLSSSLAKSALDFSHQAEKLSHQNKNPSTAATHDENADVTVETQFVTPQDPVILTSGGHRLPGVPLKGAHKLNFLKEELGEGPRVVEIREGNHSSEQKSQSSPLPRQMPPSHTNPLSPPLPLYGPPSLLRDFQCALFRLSSFSLSLAFLAVVVLGALFTSIPSILMKIWYRLTFRNPDASRPFYEEEQRRAKTRREIERTWTASRSTDKLLPEREGIADEYIPTEGGPDPVVCDVGYYARRVGLDVEEFQVQTEDGFIIDLWHVFDPKEYTKLTEEERANRGPGLFMTESRRCLYDENDGDGHGSPGTQRKPKFPVLLIHGLLQSAGAYCANDDDSLAFYLCKSGYDVWLGNNRCGFRPRHVLLQPSDPRMWCWNIRHMGVFDLPALTSRVLYETGFDKLGLVAHSQGTTQALVALAKEQRPELGDKLTVFCALAPACYAGPLIGKAYFKFMRVISPAIFRLVFGIHAFIGQMMTWHALLPPRLYGWLGYKVFSFLFDWSDKRWDCGLRDRMFQFAPVYVSAESMRWWLGRECFAKHKCILATKESVRAEEKEAHTEDHSSATENKDENNNNSHDNNKNNDAAEDTSSHSKVQRNDHSHDLDRDNNDNAHSLPAAGASVDGPPSESAARTQMRKPHDATAWYNERAPPFALWVTGNDDLVDGRKLLRRLERGREPFVKVVHSAVLEGYEHLDIIWAMDAPDLVFSEVREVLWKTCHVRDVCKTPKGCEDVKAWKADEEETMGTVARQLQGRPERHRQGD